MRFEGRGKFLFLDDEKLYLKGVRVDGPEEVFAGATDLGVNLVWLSDPTPARLDAFAAQGLRAVVELGFAQCLARLFAGDRQAFEKWRLATVKRIRGLRGHPAVLAYDLGGPATAAVHGWLGDKKLERHLRRAYKEVRRLDSKRPVTCSQSSTSAHLGRSFLDFFTCLIREDSLSGFRAAVAKVQNAVGGYPLIVRTAGADSSALGETQQAYAIDQQIRMGFIAGCAGVVLDSWHDSSGAGPQMGLLTHCGRRKEAFEAARTAMAEMPFAPYLAWPRFSVVVCVHNGEKDIEECLEGASRLDYPDFEVIIVNDGSTDRTLERAQAKADKYGFRIVTLPKSGISRARNIGMECATGEIIAYLDSDAFPDPHWLRYLALTFLGSKHAVVGGPNLNPLTCGPIADCIDQAPGNPQLVMTREELADHVPGCNLAVRRSFMKSMGGFDESYRGGGDDVHFCWKVLRWGGTLGASHGAMVWHYRRQTIRGFLRQQMSYGRGEAPLERDWPERFNSLGHQVRARTGLGAADRRKRTLSFGSRVYQSSVEHGTFFQILTLFPSMPEWPFISVIFGGLSALAVVWRPFLVFLPAFLSGMILWIAYAVSGAARARLRYPSVRTRGLVAFLYMTQPLARVLGRLKVGMTPWRSRAKGKFIYPSKRVVRVGLPSPMSHDQAQAALGRIFHEHRLPRLEGGHEYGWDWQIEGGLFGGVRCLLNVDGGDLSIRIWPYVGPIAWLLSGIFAAAVAVAVWSNAPALAVVLTLPILAAFERVMRHAGQAMGSLLPLLRKERWVVSVWADFRPPRHFFEHPAHDHGREKPAPLGTPTLS